jgi:hypothetical protein
MNGAETRDRIPEPMLDGFRNGQTDRRNGFKLEYSFRSFPSDSEYARQYSHGYRRGILGLPLNWR